MNNAHHLSPDCVLFLRKFNFKSLFGSFTNGCTLDTEIFCLVTLREQVYLCFIFGNMVVPLISPPQHFTHCFVPPPPLNNVACLKRVERTFLLDSSKIALE